MEGIKWDLEVDALVVGSGAGGMAAALTAREEGLDVLLVEKTDRIGGSTAISGGALWIPLNAQSEGRRPSRHLRTGLDLSAADRGRRVLRRDEARLPGSRAAHDGLPGRARPLAGGRAHRADYYPDRPGAAMGGRSLDPVEFDGRKLGAKFRELRDPLKEFTVLGGMMVNITDVRHLLRATRSFTAWRHSMKLVLRYAADRLGGRHRGTRLLLGNALAAQLFHGLIRRGIPYWLNTAARTLHRDANGRVLGLAVTRESKTLNIRARRGVVMATGGFPWDAKRREQTYPKPAGLWSMSPRDNAGDGIRLAEHAGAALGSGYASPAFWAPVSVLERPGQPPLHYPHLVWDRAKPGLIAVNAQGERFVNESTSYHEFVQAMQRSPADAVPAFLICGQRFIDTWGLGLALPGGRPRQHLIDAGYLLQAPTLAALAGRLGVPADKLQATVARHDAHAAQGQDPDFGKGGTAYNRYLGDPEHQPNPCLAPLGDGPYYAVKVYPGDIGTACGIAANEHAQAIDDAGRPIAGLYVAGNDMQSVMGGAYPAPGITLGPALTFGWVAGRHLAGATS